LLWKASFRSALSSSVRCKPPQPPEDAGHHASVFGPNLDLPLTSATCRLPRKHNLLAAHYRSAKPCNQLTSVKLQATLGTVKIRNIVHKGLKWLYAEDNAKGVPPDTVDKLRKMLAFLDDMEAPEELRALPSWKVHTLTGDRKGTWSLTVTRNRRLTFRIDTAENEICDLNLEDYHEKRRSRHYAHEESAASGRFHSH